MSYGEANTGAVAAKNTKRDSFLSGVLYRVEQESLRRNALLEELSNILTPVLDTREQVITDGFGGMEKAPPEPFPVSELDHQLNTVASKSADFNYKLRELLNRIRL